MDVSAPVSTDPVEETEGEVILAQRPMQKIGKPNCCDDDDTEFDTRGRLTAIKAVPNA